MLSADVIRQICVCHSNDKQHYYFQISLGLRDLADRSNRNVTQWWNTDFSYPDDLSTGVIATMHDYIASTDMVHFAIERNRRVATLLKLQFIQYPTIVIA